MKKTLSERPYAMECLLLLTTFFWGLSFLWCKEISMLHVDLNAYVAIRYAIAVVLLLPFCWKDLKTVTRRDLLHGFILGALYYGAQTTQVWGLKYTTPGNSSFITSSYVVLVPLLSWFLLRQKPEKRLFLSISLCLAGLYILNFTPGQGLQINLGNALTMLCALCWAVQVTYLSYAARTTRINMLIILPLFFGSALSSIAALFTGGLRLEGVALAPFFKTVLLLVIFPTILAGYAQSYAQKRISPTRASVIYTTESVFACVLSALLGYERLTPRLIIGGGLIIAAVLLNEVHLPRRSHPPAAEEPAPAEPLPAAESEELL